MLAVVVRNLENNGRFVSFADGSIYKSSDKLLVDIFLHHREIFLNKDGSIGEFGNRLKAYEEDFVSRWDKLYIEFSMFYTDSDLQILAYVTDRQEIVITNSDYFTSLIKIEDDDKTEYISAVEYGYMHDKTPTQIRRLCNAKRIPGVKQVGKTFLIPKNAPYPSNRSITNGQYKKKSYN